MEVKRCGGSPGETIISASSSLSSSVFIVIQLAALCRRYSQQLEGGPVWQEGGQLQQLRHYQQHQHQQQVQQHQYHPQHQQNLFVRGLGSQIAPTRPKNRVSHC